MFKVKSCVGFAVSLLFVINALIADEPLRPPGQQFPPYFNLAKATNDGIALQYFERVPVEKEGEYVVQVPVTEQVEQAYTVLVPVKDSEGTTKQVKEQRTRTLNVTKFVQETRTGRYEELTPKYSFRIMPVDSVRIYKMVSSEKDNVEVNRDDFATVLKEPQPVIVYFKDNKIEPYFYKVIAPGTLLIELQMPAPVRPTIRAIATDSSSSRPDPIPILTEADSRMFPESWLEPPITASAKSLASREIERSLVAVRRAYNKYPQSVLRNNLDRIYVIGELKYSGISSAGTNSSDRLYIKVKSEEDGFTNEFIEEIFHHEFSSILLRNYPKHFAKSEWMAANPAEFRYGDSGTDAIKGGTDSEDYDPKLSKHGFFSQYAMASLEDDFNTIAQALFCVNEDLWSAADRHSPIETKVKIAINFFRSLDEKLDRDFFRNLATRPQTPE